MRIALIALALLLLLASGASAHTMRVTKAKAAVQRIANQEEREITSLGVNVFHNDVRDCRRVNAHRVNCTYELSGNPDEGGRVCRQRRVQIHFESSRSRKTHHHVLRRRSDC